jgi:hypothetical protein
MSKFAYDCAIGTCHERITVKQPSSGSIAGGY